MRGTENRENSKYMSAEAAERNVAEGLETRQEGEMRQGYTCEPMLVISFTTQEE